jgi:hypothetical protein
VACILVERKAADSSLCAVCRFHQKEDEQNDMTGHECAELFDFNANLSFGSDSDGNECWELTANCCV